jgi:hypothetical protein
MYRPQEPKEAKRAGARRVARRLHNENPRQVGRVGRHHRFPGGEAADAPRFETLLDIGPDIHSRAAIGDKGYAGKVNRAAARARGIAPVIPHKASEKDKLKLFARTIYKARARIEQGIGRVKRFKRVTLHREKTARKFAYIPSIPLICR